MGDEVNGDGDPRSILPLMQKSLVLRKTKTLVMRIYGFALLSLLALIGCSSEKNDADPSGAERPNVLLIVIDDLGWKDVGFMGSPYYQTPNLDRLAQKSVRFTHAYAGAANCAPSRACLMSGQQTTRHGIYTVGDPDRGNEKTRKLIATPNADSLAGSFITLGEILQGEGYATATMGKWHLGHEPRAQGFDRNVGGTIAGHPRTYFSPYKNPNLSDGPEGEYLTDRLTDEALSFIEENKERPFFLYLPYFTIHTPLQGKPELVEKYKDIPMREGQGRNPNYSAMVETMDTNVGRILEKLETLGLDNTLVIFTSDNGGISYLSRQRPLRAGKGSYYEGGIRVPFLFYWKSKGVQARTSETPITNLDLYPTLLELLNIDPPENYPLDGQSIAGHLLEDAPIAERTLLWHFPIYLQAYRIGGDESRDSLFRTRPGTVLRKGKWKLHEYFEDGGLELYDLETDPGERQNLAEEMPEKLRELHDEMKEWRTEMNAPVPTELNPAYDPGFRPKGRNR